LFVIYITYLRHKFLFHFLKGKGGRVAPFFLEDHKLAVDDKLGQILYTDEGDEVPNIQDVEKYMIKYIDNRNKYSLFLPRSCLYKSNADYFAIHASSHARV
jgi:hypothetical protein